MGVKTNCTQKRKGGMVRPSIKYSYKEMYSDDLNLEVFRKNLKEM